MTGEEFNTGAATPEQNSAQPGETTFQNLSEQIKFSKENAIKERQKAEQLKGQFAELSQTGKNVVDGFQAFMKSEQSTDNQESATDSVTGGSTPGVVEAPSNQGNEFEPVVGDNREDVSDAQETTKDNPEQPEDNPEQTEDNSEKVEDNPDQKPEREKSRAEKRLEAMQERLKNIEQELSDTHADKERLEEEIDACETAIEGNIGEHNQLTDKVNKLKLEIKRTNRNIISGFANGLKVAKNLVLGRNEEVRKILGEIGDNNDANEKAKADQAETISELEANEAERLTLDNAYANAVDERNMTNSKIVSLERQKAELSKRIELMKEEAANEAWSEAWKDAKEGIKAEMGDKSLSAYKRELSAQRKQLDEALANNLDKLDKKYRNPDEVDRLMRTEEELQRDAERADEVEAILKNNYNGAASTIDAKREKVDQYFPTWRERIKTLRENNLVGGALSTLKRKALMRIYGIAN